MLTKRQFNVLDALICKKTSLTQRQISKITGLSVGSVNKTLFELEELKYYSADGVTETGLDAMEPYRVKNAVIIAAGFGSRLVPITLNTPKPLVRVNGKRIIDSILDALVEVGINNIYIVRGYLFEQFDQLLYKYPMIKFIENPLYNQANNISSIVSAKDKLQNTYVLEADLLLRNHELIKKYQYMSNYLAIPVEKTDDWCFYSNNGIATNMGIGGINCHQMVGISYWTQEDGVKLERDCKKTFEAPGGKERYWDQVPLEYCKKNYKIGIRPCTFEDIVEIDTFEELKRLDSSYGE